MMYKIILTCLCLAAIFFYSCDNNSTGTNNNTTDTTHNTDPNEHHNPANNPFVGKWGLVVDTTDDGKWPISEKLDTYGCIARMDSMGNTYYECNWKDTLLLNQDSISRGILISGLDKLYCPAVYFYDKDSIYIVDRTPCMAVGCTDTTYHNIGFSYKLSGDTLFMPYIPNTFNPYYLKGK